MTLADYNIPDLPEQKYCVACPQCAHARRKPGTKSLMVYRDGDVVRWECLNIGCEWNGDRQFLRQTKAEEITYEAPEFIYPIPEGTPRPTIAGPHTLYEYRNTKGELLFYKVRIDNKDGSKKFYPLSLAKDGGWIAKQPPLKVFYGLEDIHKSNQVVIVEGEKARDRAKERLSKAVILAWPGSAAGAITIPEELKQKEIIIWPDNDEAGLKQARELAQQLSGTVYMVDPSSLPPKADLGDDLTDDQIAAVWNTRELVSFPTVQGHYTSVDFESKFANIGQGDLLLWDSMSQLYLPRSGMIIIEGRSGHGKTTLMVNIMAQYIKQKRRPLVFYSYEMPAERILLKLVMVIDGRKLHDVPYKNEEAYIKEILAGQNATYNDIVVRLGKDIFITDEYLPFDKLMQDLHGAQMSGARVFIDYLQYIPAGSSDEDNRYLMIKNFAEQLQNVSHKNNFLLYAGAQLTPGSTPEQDSPREGRDIHNAAEMVLRVWNRPSGEAMGVTRKQLANLPGDVFIELRKNRNGWTGQTYCFDLVNGHIFRDITTSEAF